MVKEAKSDSFLKKKKKKKNLNKIEKNWIGNPRFILTMVYLIWAHNTCGAQPSLPRNQKQILQMIYYFNFRIEQNNKILLLSSKDRVKLDQNRKSSTSTTPPKINLDLEAGYIYFFMLQTTPPKINLDLEAWYIYFFKYSLTIPTENFQFTTCFNTLFFGFPIF